LRKLILLSRKPLSRTTIPPRCMVNCVGVGVGRLCQEKHIPLSGMDLNLSDCCGGKIFCSQIQDSYTMLDIKISHNPCNASSPHPPSESDWTYLQTEQLARVHTAKTKQDGRICFLCSNRCVAERGNNRLSPSIITYCIEITEDKVYEG
jgi:hypothetical protein